MTKTFGQNSYNLLEYPENIGGSRYPHYVVFFINVNTRGVINQAAGSVTYEIPQDQRKTQNNGVVITASSLVPTFIGGKAPTKRLNSAIALHMPEAVVTSSSMEYDTAEANWAGKAILGTTEGIKNALASGKDFVTGANKASNPKGGSVLSGAQTATRETIGGILSLGTNGTDGTTLMGGITGKVDNPRTETLFKSTKIRSHEFKYTFYPTSEKDSKIISAIIKKFKLHMHPELQGNNKTAGTSADPSFLVVPDEFDIEFYNKNKENTSIHKIATSVLTDMHVDYTGPGGFTAFNGTSNPIQITLSLSFTELEPITRSQVESGY